MTEYIIFAVGFLVMLMVCGGLFFATATEMVSHSYHKADARQRPVETQKKADSEI